MTDKLRRLFAGDEKLTVDRGPENRTGREACLGRCSVEAERDRLRAENARLTLALDEALAGYAHVDPNTRRGDDPQAVADDLTASRERGSFVPGIPGFTWPTDTVLPITDLGPAAPPRTVDPFVIPTKEK